MTQPTFNYARLISWLSAFLVFLYAVGAFTLSYFSLWDLALAHGLPERLAWIWPLLVDFALVVFSLSVVRAKTYGERALWPWCMVALFTMATIVFNIIHAKPTYLDWAIAVVAPLGLFLSFETLMGMVEAEVKRAGVRLPAQPPTQPAQIQTSPTQVVNEPMSCPAQAVPVENEPVAQEQAQQAQVESAEGEPVEAGLTERQAQVLALLNDKVSQPEIARRLGVSLNTVKREKEKLNGRVKDVRLS